MDISFDDLIPGQKKVAPKDISFDDLVPRDPYAAQAKQDTNAQNLLASIGGAMYAPYLKGKQALGLASPEDVQQYKDSMSGLWSTPMGKAGTVAGGAAVAAPFAIMAGPSALGAAAVGAGLGAAQPTGPNDSTLLNAAVGGAGGVAGKYAGDLIGKGATALFANKSANLATQQAANAVRDATTTEAQNAGYALPPQSSNPGFLNGMLEGVSGKIKTAQKASLKNQPITNELAGSELGLPPGEPITPEALSGVREAAGQAYKAVADFGTLKSDRPFLSAAAGIENSYSALTKSFQSLRDPNIEALISDLKAPEFDAGGVVEVVKRLRSDGFTNMASLKPADKALGRVQLQAQGLLEGLIDRNLAKAGMPDALSALQDARVQIAKSYSVQKALNESTGDVSAAKLAQQLARGKPLSGNLQTIAQTAQAFPKAMQNMTSSVPPISPLDVATAAISHGLGGLATLGARPLVRAGILSGPYQRAMAGPQSYNMGLLGSQLPKLDNATLKLLERLGGSSASLSVPWGNPQ